MSEHRKIKKISRIHNNITTVISVSLVLLLLGIVSLLGVSAHRAGENMRENMGFTVVIADDVSEVAIADMKREWAHVPYVKTMKYVSRADALKQWEAETGEDLMKVLGVNPLSAEFEITVRSAWANTDSLAVIEGKLLADNRVVEIQMQKDVVDRINELIHRLAVLLLVVAAALVVISVALINNTVRLTVYSRRFLIYTMKLVGATPGFIRRPFIMVNMVNGLIAACIAMVMLTGLLYYVMQFESGWGELFSLEEVAIVFASMLVLGAVLCALSALFAANRYIGFNYDELYIK